MVVSVIRGGSRPASIPRNVPRRAFQTIGASHPAVWPGGEIEARPARARGRGPRAVPGFGMAVDGDFGNPSQEFCRPVLAFLEIEQGRSFVDEPRCVIAGDEARMVDDIVQEGEIGGHAANAIFEKRAIHSADRFFRCRRPGCDFFKQGIVVTGDDGTRNRPCRHQCGSQSPSRRGKR